MNAPLIPDFSGRRIDAVLLDYGLRLWTDDNWELLLAGPVTVSAPAEGPDGPAVRQSTESVDTPRPDTLPEWVDGLVGRTIRQVLVSARGDLGIVLDDRQLGVAPSPDVEAWQVAGHDGERLICGPGGRVTHFSPTRRAD